MRLRVTIYGEKVLRQVGKKVERFDEGLKSLSQSMLETMYEEEGVGLAAQQIGEALQLCVIDIGPVGNSLEMDYELDGRKPPLELIMPMVLVNPEIEVLPGKTITAEEGCLSFPNIRCDVPRAEVIEVNYQDVEGAKHHLRASGWFARVVQHEVDHLNGKLFIDYLETRSLRNLDSKLKKLKRQSKAMS